MAQEKILIVEDEEDVQELIRYNLEKNGFRCDIASDGLKGLEKAKKSNYDLILLDLMIPGVDGLEVCKQLKKNAETEAIPIVMLTAKGTEADIVTGLEMGADDYVTKPFSPRILIARLKAVLRRNETPADPDQTVICIHGLEIDSRRHCVMLDQAQVHLTSTEFSMLKFLASRPGWVFTRYQIVDAVHGNDYPVTDRSVDVQIVGLRKKLGTAGKYIETVHGVGYRFRDTRQQ